MTDERLQSLYRRMTAAPAGEGAVGADDLVDALSRSGYPDQEGTPLDRIAASAVHADLLRAAQALAPDAAQLSREVAALRAPRAARLARPRWLALAAGVGAAAVLVTGLRLAQSPTGPAHELVAQPSDEIWSASFETAPQTASAQDAQPLFSGGFDS